MSEEIFFKGVTWGFCEPNGYFGSPAGKREVRKIADAGAEWVCLVTTVMQETFGSLRQFRDFRYTPSDDELIGTIRALHRAGIKVMLRPMIECLDGSNRGDIWIPWNLEVIPGRPRRMRTAWFESYADLTRHYCRIAEDTGCEAYGFDSELNFFVGDTPHWMTVVEAARKSYHGHLTTSIQNAEQYTGLLRTTPDHWFFALDSVGTSHYPPLTDRKRPFRADLEQCREFAAVYKKTFYFGELGCRSAKGALGNPAGFTGGSVYDGNCQAEYLAAFLNTFSREFWWRGFFWWKWDTAVPRKEYYADPAGAMTFDLSGKPAEKVFRDWKRSAPPSRGNISKRKTK